MHLTGQQWGLPGSTLARPNQSKHQRCRKRFNKRISSCGKYFFAESLTGLDQEELLKEGETGFRSSAK